MNIPLYRLEDYCKNKSKLVHTLDISYPENKLTGEIGFVHQQNYFEIIIANEGNIKLEIEQDEYIISKGNISVIFPGQIHKKQYDKNIKGIILMFDEVMFCSDLLKNELRAYTVDLYRKLNYVKLESEEYNYIRDIAVQINKLYETITPIRQEQIRFYIKILLLKLIEVAHDKTLPEKNIQKLNIYARFRELIEDNYTEIKTVSEYAGKMGISTKKLNEICKDEAGMTALSVIHERIMVEIKRMFLYCGNNNKEIAYQLGFASPSAFNKFIYSKAGKTPTELRLSLSQMDKK